MFGRKQEIQVVDLSGIDALLERAMKHAGSTYNVVVNIGEMHIHGGQEDPFDFGVSRRSALPDSRRSVYLPAPRDEVSAYMLGGSGQMSDSDCPLCGYALLPGNVIFRNEEYVHAGCAEMAERVSTRRQYAIRGTG